MMDNKIVKLIKVDLSFDLQGCEHVFRRWLVQVHVPYHMNFYSLMIVWTFSLNSISQLCATPPHDQQLPGSNFQPSNPTPEFFLSFQFS